jgi:hypothetical protein
MLILMDDLDQCVAARDATTVERITALFRVARLDRDLASGVSPDSSAPLALRAQALVRPSTRRSLAQCLQQLLAEANHPGPPRLGGTRVRVKRERVLYAAAGLQLLIDRLVTPGPVPARGVALVRVLLTDGAGPLYYRGADDDLIALILAAVEHLAPLSGW